MDFENCLNMDPHLLVGLINTAIRNQHGSLQELCASHQLESTALIEKLAKAGYAFFPEQQQFR
ncbi:MAG: hypothetical protein CNE95_03955 [Puniceicoccaceae bacterium MED-G30]|jgi:hypothetical protein|nr:MAG: hypothetical protein CNE95_03955 [Puniceicoccaceae bacterium MED-G30]|tara:strand:+ start:617 stop:805 length:189 start_codon:yes stop_codon:yes gene_type:complete